MIVYSFLFLPLFYSIVSAKINSSYLNSVYMYSQISFNNISDCLGDVFYDPKPENFECMIKVIKDPGFKEFIKDQNNILLITGLIKLYLNMKKMVRLETYLNDIFLNDTNNLLNLSIDLIVNDSSNYILYNLSDIIVNYSHHQNFEFIFERLQKIFIIDGFKELIDYIYYRYENDLVKILENCLKNTTYEPLFYELRVYIERYKKEFYYLAFDLVKAFKNRKETINILIDFILNNSKDGKTILKDAREIANNYTLSKHISDTVKLDSPVADKVFEEIILNTKLMNFIFDFLEKRTNVEKLKEVLLNLPNKTYIEHNIIPFVKETFAVNDENMDFLLNTWRNILKNMFMDNKVKSIIFESLIDFVEEKIFKEELNKTDISGTCNNFIDYIFKNESKNTDVLDLKYFYLIKIFIDSTKNKNDFLTYENCLYRTFSNSYSEKYNIEPIFLVGAIKDEENQEKLKSSTAFEKYCYYIGFCFPYGKEKDGSESCSIKDYNKILKAMVSFYSDASTTNISSFIIKNDELSVNTNDYIKFCISLILTAFPLIIYVFLILYDKIKKYKIINDENDNQNHERKKNIAKYDVDNINKNNNLIKIIYPSWYKFLNEYFNLVKNGTELFNFSINVTRFNNFNGITYIKGILGISTLFHIFGFTFLILSNKPIKIFGAYQFYNTIYNPLYILAFIGLRYCPRIIFSCSGYTLVYKFLCFIERDPNFCFIKFLILQSYKYILLILISLFMRYSLYYINVIFRHMKTPVLKIYELNLNEKSNGYFNHLFSFLFDEIKDLTTINNEKSVIYYLYLPINEVFLFIIGTGLITLGYKYKFRIDILILFIIMFIYFAKLIPYLILKNEKPIYPTLYFFLFGYGELMLNPLFNMPSFFIGMYFGLVNYTIQKGVNSKSKKSSYIQIELNELSSLNSNENNGDDENNNQRKSSFPLINEKIYNKDSRNSKTNALMRHLSCDTNKDDSSYISEKENIKNNNLELFKMEERQKSLESFNDPLDSKSILFQMPFLKSPIKFTNFHRRNQNNFFFKILFMFFLLLFLFFISIIYIMIYINVDSIINSKEKMEYEETNNHKKKGYFLSFENIIPNNFINIVLYIRY